MTADDKLSGLLRALTLEEKCTLLSGKNMWETASIPRLGIKSLKTSDGPAGVRGSRWVDGTHTTFIPCGISLAATFDPALIERVGGILGAEAKTKGAHVLLAPTMNISRSPFGGRNFENFGEDPFLTGRMAISYIKGVQNKGVAACMKHFVANDMETRRFNMDQTIDQRTLREIYLKPFQMALEANPLTAMTAYPKINGTHVDASRNLVHDILREEWNYGGLVMSDWGGLNSTVDSIRATTDLEMPGPPLRYGKALMKAVESGHISETQHVDPSVQRLLRLLNHDQLNAMDIAAGEGESDTLEFRRTTREAASQGIVLLKNNNRLLPLQPSRIKKLAIIGPNAKNPTLGGTGSAIVNPYYTTNPYDSITSAAKQRNPDIEIRYERGIFTHLQPPLIGHCLTQPNRKAKLFIDGQVLIDNTEWNEISGNFMNCGSVECFASMILEAGKTYRLSIDNIVVPPPTKPHDNTLFHKISGVRVGMLFKHDEQAMFNDAVNAAQDADAVVLVVGHNNDTEREGSDRTSLSLPRRTDELVSAVCAANENAIVVTQSACAISMPWLDEAGVILHAWYQGQECGNAIADVVFGVVNPSGKLPVTFPGQIEDHGSHKWFPGDPANDKAEFGEGVLVGYRWFDSQDIEPLWSFGYGLSYTTFTISDVTLEGTIGHPGSSGVLVRAVVANIGDVLGSEVVQVYVSPSSAIQASSLPAAPRALAGFSKVLVPAGESKTVDIRLDDDAFKWFDVTASNSQGDTKGAWRLDKGAYKCYVGTSSRNLPWTLDLDID
ncbi:beta-glucosidase [Fusarium oxysporum]|nr:beta-glucosidase [Fusarium oxysporum]